MPAHADPERGLRGRTAPPGRAMSAFGDVLAAVIGVRRQGVAGNVRLRNPRRSANPPPRSGGGGPSKGWWRGLPQPRFPAYGT